MRRRAHAIRRFAMTTARAKAVRTATTAPVIVSPAAVRVATTACARPVTAKIAFRVRLIATASKTGIPMAGSAVATGEAKGRYLAVIRFARRVVGSVRTRRLRRLAAAMEPAKAARTASTVRWTAARPRSVAMARVRVARTNASVHRTAARRRPTNRTARTASMRIATGSPTATTATAISIQVASVCLRDPPAPTMPNVVRTSARVRPAARPANNALSRLTGVRPLNVGLTEAACNASMGLTQGCDSS